jgi:preprotein translocase subunit SecA
MNFLKKLFGDANERYIKSIDPLVNEINSIDFSKTEDLKQEVDKLKGQDLNEVLPRAFALVREASTRTLNQRHYDVQLIGGIVLHQGKVAEMRTGEGKTLAATLPVFLNALNGEGVHVVTVNDYLSRRDMVWMGQIYDALGLTTACLNHDTAYIYDSNYKEGNDELRDEQGSFKVIEDFMRPCSRKEAYQADITYGTNNEFAFDYLRDNLTYDPEGKVQRGFNYAVVDEVDSILIDEARTPLIISAPGEDASSMYREFARIIPRLDSGTDYEVLEKEKTVTLTDDGITKVEKILGLENIYDDRGMEYLRTLEQALRAQAINPATKRPLFEKDRHYVIRNGEIVIVDEFTGRMMPGRRWSGGLHQAIEAKENLQVNPESITMASITFQNYFRMYKKLSGMTGTAATSAEELDKVYSLDVVIIPTNKPLIRKDLQDLVFKTEEGKWKAIIKEVKKRHETGQPVLIGTTSIERNELLSAMLSASGIKCQVLNAKNHEKEAEIIAQAGKKGAVTVATNMAGRGVDIILGGQPYTEEKADQVREAGGLHVLGTERHEARRIDNQLRGRAGRQGDPGSSQFFLSLEDYILRVFGGDRIKRLMEVLKLPEDEPIEARMLSGVIESAQGKIEGMHFDARKHLLDYDDVINKQRLAVYTKRDFFLNEADEETFKELFQKYERPYEEKELKAMRYIALRVIDMAWVGHLRDMDELRDSVRLRAYGQRDPLVEYRNEGQAIYRNLMADVEKNIVVNIEKFKGQTIQPKPERKVVGVDKKVGRNDLCPCGSGKKYKKCCGQ